MHKMIAINSDTIREWADGDLRSLSILIVLAQKVNDFHTEAFFVMVNEVESLRGEKIRYLFEEICRHDTDFLVSLCSVMTIDTMKRIIEMDKMEAWQLIALKTEENIRRGYPEKGTIALGEKLIFSNN